MRKEFEMLTKNGTPLLAISDVVMLFSEKLGKRVDFYEVKYMLSKLSPECISFSKTGKRVFLKAECLEHALEVFANVCKSEKASSKDSAGYAAGSVQQTQPPSEILDTFPPTDMSRWKRRGAPRKYPWEVWSDGRIHKITSGVHFQTKARAFSRVAQTFAKRVGMRCRTHVDGDTLVVQFTKRD